MQMDHHANCEERLSAVQLPALHSVRVWNRCHVASSDLIHDPWQLQISANEHEGHEIYAQGIMIQHA